MRGAVAVGDLETGNVPAISVKSGRPCANAAGFRLRHVRAVLPIEASRVRARRVLLLATWPVLAIALAGAVWSFWITIAGAIAYGALVVIGDVLWVGARPGPERGTLVLTRVHRAFAEAVSR